MPSGSAPSSVRKKMPQVRSMPVDMVESIVEKVMKDHRSYRRIPLPGEKCAIRHWAGWPNAFLRGVEKNRTEEETAETLHDKLSVIGRDLLLETLPSIINKTNQRIKQDNSKATYGFIIKREDEKIDFSKSKKQIYNQIRGLNSWPGAYCLIDGKILKVWESRKSDNIFESKINGEITNIYDDGIGVKVSDGEIVLKTVQPEGKKKMNAKDYASGMINKGFLVGKILE